MAESFVCCLLLKHRPVINYRPKIALWEPALHEEICFSLLYSHVMSLPSCGPLSQAAFCVAVLVGIPKPGTHVGFSWACWAVGLLSCWSGQVGHSDKNTSALLSSRLLPILSCAGGTGAWIYLWEALTWPGTHRLIIAANSEGYSLSAPLWLVCRQRQNKKWFFFPLP